MIIYFFPIDYIVLDMVYVDFYFEKAIQYVEHEKIVPRTTYHGSLKCGTRFVVENSFDHLRLVVRRASRYGTLRPISLLAKTATKIETPGIV